jgi:TldD protein
VVLVARADGTLAADVRPLVRLSVTVIAEQKAAARWAPPAVVRFGLAYFSDEQIASMWTRPCMPPWSTSNRVPRRPA